VNGVLYEGLYDTAWIPVESGRGWDSAVPWPPAASRSWRRGLPVEPEYLVSVEENAPRLGAVAVVANCSGLRLRSHLESRAASSAAGDLPLSRSGLACEMGVGWLPASQDLEAWMDEFLPARAYEERGRRGEKWHRQL